MEDNEIGTIEKCNKYLHFRCIDFIIKARQYENILDKLCLLQAELLISVKMNN